MNGRLGTRTTGPLTWCVAAQPRPRSLAPPHCCLRTPCPGPGCGTRRALFRGVARGNMGPEAGGWYVAPLPEVESRADETGSVEVTPMGDGAFVLSLREGAFWEERCFHAFLHQQFASDAPEAIEWAL